MESWPVFLTAENVSAKVSVTTSCKYQLTNTLQTLNKAWIEIQDFGYTDAKGHGSWTLLTSRTLPPTIPGPTRALPLYETYQNASLANATLTEINDFIRVHETQLKKLNILHGLWVVLDTKGLESSSCVIVQQLFDEDLMELTDGFRALRISLHDAWNCFANLSLGNMGFEEWIDSSAGPQEDGIFKGVGHGGGKYNSRKLKDAALQEARSLGHID